MSTSSNWFVYILACHDNSLYTGITTDIERRIHEHNDSKKGAKYTRARRPVKLVYSEPADNRSTATKREIQLKSLPTSEKHALIRASQ